MGQGRVCVGGRRIADYYSNISRLISDRETERGDIHGENGSSDEELSYQVWLVRLEVLREGYEFGRCFRYSEKKNGRQHGLNSCPRGTEGLY